MFGWLFGKTKEQNDESLVKALELLSFQNDLIASLEQALVTSDRRNAEMFARGHETIAALLMSSGGEALLSKEILEVTHTSNYEIEGEPLDDGSMRLSLVPVADEPQVDLEQQAQEDSHEPS